MTPFVTIKDTLRDNSTAAANATTNTHTAKPDLSYLPTFNVAGGRPDERCGTRGSFTHGVRIMSGGPAREVPLDAEAVDHGEVLFMSSTHKPDRSGEARTNAVGGRPTERLGSSRFTPGAKTFRGGAPRDVPLEAEFLDHGKVLFVSSVHKPDMSGEARTNAVRPTERLGSHGRFTPGARRWLGGQPRDVPQARVRNPGTVIYQSSTLAQPDLSAIMAEETNVVGGRPEERRGVHGSFTHGVRIVSGGSAREMLLDAEVVDHGRVLFVSSTHKPDLSGEVRTNVTGGRPDERLGSSRFTPGARRWLGGEPRDIPAGLETTDHGIVLFPRPSQIKSSSVGRDAGIDGGLNGNDNDDDSDNNDSDNNDHDNGNAWFFETEDITIDETCQAVDAALAWKKTTAAVVRMNGTCSFNNLAERGSGGVFRRCGSDSQFNAGADLMNGMCRPSF